MGKDGAVRKEDYGDKLQMARSPTDGTSTLIQVVYLRCL